MRLQIATRALLGDREVQEDSVGVSVAGFAPQVNEAVDVSDSNALVVVADGMGGHAAGEVASVTAAHLFMAGTLAVTGTPRERLVHGLFEADRALAIESGGDRDGMGTTLLGLIVEQGQVSWVSVGDSPLWLIADGDVIQLNADHSGAPAMAKWRAAEPMRSFPEQGHVLNAVMLGEGVSQFDLCPAPVPVKAGDVLVAASDGLDAVTAQEMLAALGAPAPVIAERLLACVLAKGAPHQDNATLAVITVTP